MNIAILSGEISGDLIGGALAEALRRLQPDVTLWGLGSAAMREAGVELLHDSGDWGVISITQALLKYPYLRFNVYPNTIKALKQRRPDVLVLIDFGAFNVKVARFAKAAGIPVCYYFPPGAWRRDGDKGAELARITDLLAVPFEWSADRFQRLGANAVNVGHPLIERAKPSMSRAEFAAEFDMDPSRPIIGLLPGSRLHEVEHILPALLDAARIIHAKVPDAQFVIGVAPNLSPEIVARYLSGQPELLERLSEYWYEFALEAGTQVRKQVSRTAHALAPQGQRKLVTVEGIVVPEQTLTDEMEKRDRIDRQREKPLLPPTVLAKGLTYDVMAHSDVLITCSGTATLEATIFTTPMVILYRLSKVMEFEGRLRGLHKKIKFIGLPNILADRPIMPELLQDAATPDALAAAALRLLNDLTARAQARKELEAVRAMLGGPGASERTARLVLELAKKT
jgi:lipid-A-disaccharide synthase